MVLLSLSTAHLGLFYPESGSCGTIFGLTTCFQTAKSTSCGATSADPTPPVLYGDHRALEQEPSMAAKVEAIAHHFPDGQAVVIERPPHNILPSTGLLVETKWR